MGGYKVFQRTIEPNWRPTVCFLLCHCCAFQAPDIMYIQESPRKQNWFTFRRPFVRFSPNRYSKSIHKMQLSSFYWWETHKTFHQQIEKNALCGNTSSYRSEQLLYLCWNNFPSSPDCPLCFFQVLQKKNFSPNLFFLQQRKCKTTMV